MPGTCVGILPPSQAQPSAFGRLTGREGSTQGGVSAWVGEKSRLSLWCMALSVLTAPCGKHADGFLVMHTWSVRRSLVH